MTTLRDVDEAIVDARRVAQQYQDPDHPAVVEALQRVDAVINQLPAWKRPLWRGL